MFQSQNDINRNKDCGPSDRFWVRQDNGMWYSISVTDEERSQLRYLRSVGVEYYDE